MRIGLFVGYSLFALAATLAMPVNLAASDTPKSDLSVCGVSGMIRLVDGDTLKIHIALSEEDKIRGLSGIRETDFAEDEALLMMNFESKPRAVNMGDTWFNIDVFFLDGNLNVVALQRNLMAHPGRAEPPPIEKSGRVFARHVMEMRSGSHYAARIEQGGHLQWQSQPGVKEIEQCLEDISY